MSRTWDFRRLARIAMCAVLSLLSVADGARAETLKVLTGHIEPYAIGAGSRPGMAIEIVREMARRAGDRAEVAFKPWQRSLAEAANTPGVLIVPLVRMPERERRYAWIAAVAPGEPLYLMAIRSDVDISSFEAVRNRSVGVVVNAPAEIMLTRNQHRNQDLSTDTVIAARKLLAGRFDVWLARATEARPALAGLGVDPATLRLGLRVDVPASYLAAGLPFPEATAQRLRAALTAMKTDGTYRKIVEKYDYGWLLDGDDPPVPEQHP